MPPGQVRCGKPWRSLYQLPGIPDWVQNPHSKEEEASSSEGRKGRRNACVNDSQSPLCVEKLTSFTKRATCFDSKHTKSRNTDSRHFSFPYICNRNITPLQPHLSNKCNPASGRDALGNSNRGWTGKGTYWCSDLCAIYEAEVCAGANQGSWQGCISRLVMHFASKKL